MIKLLTRKEALEKNPLFASFIVSVQDAKYNPAKDYHMYKPQKMWVDDVLRFVTQEECDQWNLEELEEFSKRKDSPTLLVDLKDKFSGSKTFGFEPTSIENHIEKLSESIEKLSIKLNQSFFFLLDYKTPWLYQENDFEPIQSAYKHLNSIGIDKEFVGGIQCSGEELKTFISHLFWLVRCNASLPECYFGCEKSSFVMSICKYGIVHFEFYSDKEKSQIIKYCKGLGMIEMEECYDTFSDSNAIEGRQIIV
ncbi:MAG: hypothetical protein EOP53_00395 [Sphingobacteriales bacterium]|nr:MAG: hypothetical protein EOP53_00395 [Sphingobacteriales bacterium]